MQGGAEIDYNRTIKEDTLCGWVPSCGILTELSLIGTSIDYVIIGIGINVSNQMFPDEIKETASSILLETGQNIDRERFIVEIWKCFDIYYK